MRATVLATALLVALSSPEPAFARAEGRVVQVTAARVYLDAGADDGLTPGTEISIHRAGLEVARCRIEALSARSSACTAHGARAGDGFALPGPVAREEAKLLPPVTPPDQLKAQGAALSAAPVAVVEYTPPPRAPLVSGRSVATVELSEATWNVSGTTPYTATRAAVALHDVEVGLGFRLDVDAQAIRWTSRPTAPPPRFRPSDASQLYIWQAGITREPSGGGPALAAGRLLPWRIPGATLLDGAVAGWRFGALELGAFGGLVPDPVTLGIATDRSTAGGYWVYDRRLGDGAALRDEGRLALVRSPELGSRYEAETRAMAWFGRSFDLSGSLRLGMGGSAQAPGKVDAGRLEVGGRPSSSFRVAAWFAYDGLDVSSPTEPAVVPGHGRRAEASGSYEFGSYRLTLLGGTATDDGSALSRTWVGPILDLPRLFASRGGLSVGYLEELGWSDGRSAWVQGLFRPWASLRLFARLSWSHASAIAVMPDEFGAAVGAVADLSRHFTARLSGSYRAGVDLGGGANAGGFSVLATVAARY